jgi:hypothetical protein
MKTRILFELETDGIPKLDKILPKAINRFSDCFTSANVNVKSCTATLLPSEQPEIIGLAVRSEPPVQMPAEDE